MDTMVMTGSASDATASRGRIAAGTAIGAGLVPLFRLDIDAGSKAALSVMHLVVGATAIGGHALVRARR